MHYEVDDQEALEWVRSRCAEFFEQEDENLKLFVRDARPASSSPKQPPSMELLLECSRLTSSSDVHVAQQALALWALVFRWSLSALLPDELLRAYYGPLLLIQNAFSELRNGASARIFQPVAVNGRHSDSNLQMTFKVLCVVASDEFLASASVQGGKRSRIARPEADAKVLKDVANVAKFLEIALSSTSLKGWRKMIARERARAAPSKLAAIYDEWRSIAHVVRERFGTDSPKLILGAIHKHFAL